MPLERKQDYVGLDHKYGWRLRIGYLSPGIVDETVSRSFYRMAPPGVTLVRTSLGVRGLSTGEIDDALGRSEAAVRELMREGVDVITLGGSPPVVIGGPGADTRIIEMIEGISGTAATTAQTSAIEAMRALDIKRVAVASPFDATFNDPLAEFIKASGVEVRSFCSAPTDLREMSRLPLRTAYDLARRAYSEADGADGVYIPCAQFPVVDAIEALEQDLGTKIVTSLQASLWNILGLRSLGSEVKGYGALFEHTPTGWSTKA